VRPDNRYVGSAVDPDARPSLRDPVRRRQRVTASCLFCRHVAHVDPAALVERFGYNFPVTDLFTRFKCSKCGSRRVDVHLSGEDR